MMMTKIVADSSADLLTLGDLPFASVPLTIHAGDRVFVDDEHCDIDGMIAFLRTYKEKTTTSCPNTECWLKSFGDADTVYCVTISTRRCWRRRNTWSCIRSAGCMCLTA